MPDRAPPPDGTGERSASSPPSAPASEYAAPPCAILSTSDGSVSASSADEAPNALLGRGGARRDEPASGAPSTVRTDAPRACTRLRAASRASIAFVTRSGSGSSGGAEECRTGGVQVRVVRDERDAEPPAAIDEEEGAPTP